MKLYLYIQALAIQEHLADLCWWAPHSDSNYLSSSLISDAYIEALGKLDPTLIPEQMIPLMGIRNLNEYCVYETGLNHSCLYLQNEKSKQKMYFNAKFLWQWKEGCQKTHWDQEKGKEKWSLWLWVWVCVCVCVSFWKRERYSFVDLKSNLALLYNKGHKFWKSVLSWKIPPKLNISLLKE